MYDPEQERGRQGGKRNILREHNGAVFPTYPDNLQETHDNLLQIFGSLNLHDCKYSLAADMKLINIFLGISALFIIIQIDTLFII